MNKLELKKRIAFSILIAPLILQTAFAEQRPTKPPALVLSKPMLLKIKKMPYDNTTFILAYKTLVYNSQIFDAYQLALIAVAKRPRDLSWHKKLAQVAIWAGDYDTGMKEWLYVIKRRNKIANIEYVIKIATTFGYDQVLIDALNLYLAQNPDDIELYLQLAKAENRIGNPEKALKIINKANAIHPTREAYELIAGIYTDMDEWGKALETWKNIDKLFGANTKSGMAEAVIYYTADHFQKALDSLKKAIPSAKRTDIDFWKTLADMAWIVNDIPMVILGYSHDLKNESTLISLIQVEEIVEPKKAFIHSLKGWHLFHNPLFLTASVYLGQQQNQWQSLNRLLLSLSNEQLKNAAKEQFFWEAQVGFYAAIGNKGIQKKVLVQAIELHPDMLGLRSNLLWLVMGDGENRWIKQIMQGWYQQNLINNPLLWHAFAEGFGVFNRFYTAILVYQNHLFNELRDNQVLIDYASLLEKAKLNQQALNMRRLLWQRGILDLEKSTEFDKSNLKTLGQLAPFFVSGTLQVQIFKELLSSKEVSADDYNAVLNWLVPRNYYYLISFFKSYYLNNNLPDWAEINLALIKNDLPSLQNIISHTDREWTRSDRINAAVRLENTPLAVDLAFDELTERPNASEIQSEFIQYALESANFHSLSGEYEQFVNLIGPRTILESKIRLTNTWKMTPYFSVWNTKTNDPRVLTNVPEHDVHSTIKFEQKIHRGKVFYNLGYRKALSGFTPASIDINYQLNSRWTADIKLGLDQEDFQNAYLRIGGLQDQINLRLAYNLTQRDLFSIEGQGLNYYSQNRHYLANGYNLFGQMQHKFWLSYPDFSLALFGNLYHFNRNGSFGGNVTTLFPTLPEEILFDPTLTRRAQLEQYQQLIPNSYSECGFNFSIGDSILGYSHNWRPYFWASLFYNSITRLSNDVKGGIVGSILGRDSLLLYAERGSAPTTVAQVNYLLGIRYRLYY